MSIKIIDYANILKSQEEVSFVIINPNKVEISYDRDRHYKKLLEERDNVRNIPLP